MTQQTKTLEELFAAGVHLGHKTNRIHPQARKYIYKIDAGTSIIDLTQTLDLLEKARKFIVDLAKHNKILLIVCTKKIVSQSITTLAQANNLPYVTIKWPAGLLTNFETIIKNIKKLREMREAKSKGEWDKFVKHEQTKLTKELNKLERFYGGLVTLEKLPDVLFIVDIKKEKNAVIEAQKMNVPVIAVADTNVDPNLVIYPIPGNDDSESSILYLVNNIIETYSKGKKV